MSPPEDPLDRLLDRLHSTPPIAGVREEVWQRIEQREAAKAQPGLFSRLETRFARPALALFFVTTCVLGVLLFAERQTSRHQGEVNTELARQYLRLIDPLRDASASALSLERELAWLQDELHLSPVQFAQIKKFHEASSSELHALASEVVRMRKESATLEAERRAEDRVDFLAVGRLAETQRIIDLERLDSTQRLVTSAVAVMTPEQSRLYLRYVQVALLPEPRPAAY